jgi:hypothetical protein
MNASDNLMRWDRLARGHYEVWYLTLNDRAARAGFWIRYTIESPLEGHGEPYAQLWFAAFYRDEPGKSFGINRRFAVSELIAAHDPFELRIGDAALRHDGAAGALAGGGHDVRWELGWPPAPRSHRLLPDLVYQTSFADTQVLTPSLGVPVRGTVEVDGRRHDLDGETLAQSHLWGRRHAYAWAWGRCTSFDGHAAAALETLTVQLERRGVVLPPVTLLALYLDGARLVFTGFRDMILTRGRFATARYSFTAQGLHTRLEGDFTCRPDDLLLTEYTDPDGAPIWCANTEIADLSLRVFRRRLFGPWEAPLTLHATATAHFEVASRTPDGAVATRHTAI